MWPLAFLLWTFISAFAQETEISSWRIRSDLVVVDVIATDGDGRFLTDLRKEDFEVREDGKIQELVYCRLLDANVGPDEGTTGTTQVAADAVDFGKPSGVRLVFLIDLESVAASDLEYTRRQIRSFLEGQRGQGHHYMLASVGRGLRVHVPFTDDVETLSAALDAIPGTSDSRARESHLTSFMAEIEPHFQIASRDRLYLLAPVETAVADATFFLSRLEDRVARITSETALLARSLRSLPGRKHVVFYSGGYPLNPSRQVAEIIRERMMIARPDMNGGERSAMNAILARIRHLALINRLRDLIDETNRSQVSIYSVDARALVPTTGVPQAHQRRSGMQHRPIYQNFAAGDIAAPQDFLVSLARESGGVSYLNSNDLTRGVARALRDAGRYYLLAYRPTSARKEGRFHKVRVKVHREGTELQFRRGYYEVDGLEVAREEVLNALRFPMLFRDFDFRIEVEPQGNVSWIRTHVPTGVLDFSLGDGGVFHCPLETYGVLIDPETGRWIPPGLQFAKQHQIEGDQGRLDEIRGVDYVTSVSEVDVAPGDYQLIVVVRQSLAGRISAKVLKVRLEMSSPPIALLGRR